MTNKIPRKLAALLALAASAIAGAVRHAALIVKNTSAAITADRTGVTAAEEAFQQARTTLALRYDALEEAKAAARTFIQIARDLLKPILGTRYHQGWDETGLIGSLEIPRSVAELEAILQRMGSFLGAHVTYQKADAGVTAEKATEALTALQSARDALNAQRETVADAKQDRDAAVAKLSNRIRGLIGELKQVFGPMDAEWLSFGLNRPGALSTPEVPTGLIVTLVGTNAAALKWDAAPRAEYYRIWKRVLGVDTELVAVGNPADLDFYLEGLPANATIEIAISAVNNGGESAKTAVVQIQTA